MRRVVEVESGGLAFEANSARRRKASGTGSWTGLSEDEESELEEEVAWEA